MSEIRTVRILLTGLCVIVLAFVVMFLVVTGYAVKLGIEARGQPDQEAIQLFAERIGSWLGPTTSALLTFIGAFWVGTKATSRKMLNGTLVGLVVGVVALLFAVTSGLGLDDLVGVLTPVGLGWLGGMLAARRAPASVAT